MNKQKWTFGDGTNGSVPCTNTAITWTLDLSGVLGLLFDKVDLLLPYSAVGVTVCDRTNFLLEPVISPHLNRQNGEVSLKIRILQELYLKPERP